METVPRKLWSRVQPRGGTQIPQEIREALRLKPGDVLIWQKMTDRQVSVLKGELKEVAIEWPHRANQ